MNFIDQKRGEIGVAGIVLKLKAVYAEQKGYREISKLKEIYFDPFEKDSNIIQKVLINSYFKKLTRVISECSKRQPLLEKYQKKLDNWNKALRDLAQDLELLRKTKETLEVSILLILDRVIMRRC